MTNLRPNASMRVKPLIEFTPYLLMNRRIITFHRNWISSPNWAVHLSRINMAQLNIYWRRNFFRSNSNSENIIIPMLIESVKPSVEYHLTRWKYKGHTQDSNLFEGSDGSYKLVNTKFIEHFKFSSLYGSQHSFMLADDKDPDNMTVLVKPQFFNFQLPKAAK